MASVDGVLGQFEVVDKGPPWFRRGRAAPSIIQEGPRRRLASRGAWPGTVTTLGVGPQPAPILTLDLRLAPGSAVASDPGGRPA
jgi:hypothetical protein